MPRQVDQEQVTASTDAILTEIQSITHAEDSAHASGHFGIMSLGVRNDGGATTIAGTDGDYAPISLTEKSAVQIGVGKDIRDISALDVTMTSGGTTTAQVTDIDVKGFKFFSIGFECDSNAVTGDHNFDIIVSFSRDGTVYRKYQNEFWGFLRYEDTAFSTADTILLEGRIPSGSLFMQIDIVSNNLSGSETFIFDDWYLGLDSMG